MKIWIIRHGQTNENKNKLIQGSKINHPLNQQGEKQILECAKFFDHKKIVIEEIYASNLTRALQSALIVRDYLKISSKIWLMGEFVERNYGLLEGKPIPIEYKDPQTMHAESDEQLQQRVQRGLNFIEKNSKQNIAIFTHSQVLKAINKIAKGPIEYYSPINNGCILEIDYQPSTNQYTYVNFYDGQI
ncbi:MAG: histidine phosphatase family protein [Acholeplasmatales bacterium]|jgi:broad specificity phosphatase PhoE|nr:histidine phosphatase family protein [Acholeplasmatales bacterium]